MVDLPVLRTPRLTLTPLAITDAARIHELAGDAEVARLALEIPHPFEEGMAEAWISSLGDDHHVFAIREAASEALVGIVGFALSPGGEEAELSYWIGRPYWGLGFATEAARAAVEYAFRLPGVRILFATHLGENVGSAAVLAKLGFEHRETRPEEVIHFGAMHDLVVVELERPQDQDRC